MNGRPNSGGHGLPPGFAMPKHVAAALERQAQATAQQAANQVLVGTVVHRINFAGEILKAVTSGIDPDHRATSNEGLVEDAYALSDLFWDAAIKRAEEAKGEAAKAAEENGGS